MRPERCIPGGWRVLDRATERVANRVGPSRSRAWSDKNAMGSSRGDPGIRLAPDLRVHATFLFCQPTRHHRPRSGCGSGRSGVGGRKLGGRNPRRSSRGGGPTDGWHRPWCPRLHGPFSEPWRSGFGKWSRIDRVLLQNERHGRNAKEESSANRFLPGPRRRRLHCLPRSRRERVSRSPPSNYTRTCNTLLPPRYTPLL